MQVPSLLGLISEHILGALRKPTPPIPPWAHHPHAPILTLNFHMLGKAAFISGMSLGTPLPALLGKLSAVAVSWRPHSGPCSVVRTVISIPDYSLHRISSALLPRACLSIYCRTQA